MTVPTLRELAMLTLVQDIMPELFARASKHMVDDSLSEALRAIEVSVAEMRAELPEGLTPEQRAFLDNDPGVQAATARLASGEPLSYYESNPDGSPSDHLVTDDDFVPLSREEAEKLGFPRR